VKNDDWNSDGERRLLFPHLPPLPALYGDDSFPPTIHSFFSFSLCLTCVIARAFTFCSKEGKGVTNLGEEREHPKGMLSILVQKWEPMLKEEEEDMRYSCLTAKLPAIKMKICGFSEANFLFGRRAIPTSHWLLMCLSALPILPQSTTPSPSLPSLANVPEPIARNISQDRFLGEKDLLSYRQTFRTYRRQY